MISQKFSLISDDQIASFISNNRSQKEEDNLLVSIESVSDLWVLANINKTYNEENNIHSDVTDSHSDECPPN